MIICFVGSSGCGAMSATEMAKGEGNTERSGKEILALMERYGVLCWMIDFLVG